MTAPGGNSPARSPDGTEAVRREANELREARAREIVARRRVQNELRLHNGALDAATTHFMIVEARPPNYPIVYVNRVLATDHGYDGPESLIGQDVSVFSGTYLSEYDRQQYYQALANGETARVEMEITRPAGHKFVVGFSTSPWRNALGQVTHYVTLSADITARHEAERKERQLQEQLHEQMRERERMAIELRLAHELESVGRLAAGSSIRSSRTRPSDAAPGRSLPSRARSSTTGMAASLTCRQRRAWARDSSHGCCCMGGRKRRRHETCPLRRR